MIRTHDEAVAVGEMHPADLSNRLVDMASALRLLNIAAWGASEAGEESAARRSWAADETYDAVTTLTGEWLELWPHVRAALDELERLQRGREVVR